MPASPEDKPTKIAMDRRGNPPYATSALRRALLIAGLGLSATLSACGGAPEHPTYDEDVRPLLVARCVRCHTAPGQVDPLSAKTGIAKLAAVATPSFDFPYYSDLMSSPVPNAYVKSLGKYARGPVGDVPRMPPVPAAPLEDWEITMLETWAKDPR